MKVLVGTQLSANGQKYAKSPHAAHIKNLLDELVIKTPVVAHRPLAQLSLSSSIKSPSAPPKSSKRRGRKNRPSPRASKALLTDATIRRIKELGLSRKGPDGVAFSVKFSPYLSSVKQLLRKLDGESLLASPKRRRSPPLRGPHRKLPLKISVKSVVEPDWSMGLLGEESQNAPKSMPAAKSHNKRHFDNATNLPHFQKRASPPTSAPRSTGGRGGNAAQGIHEQLSSFIRMHVSRAMCKSAIQDGILCTTVNVRVQKEQQLAAEVAALRKQIAKVQSEKQRVLAAHEHDKKSLERGKQHGLSARHLRLNSRRGRKTSKRFQRYQRKKSKHFKIKLFSRKCSLKNTMQI